MSEERSSRNAVTKALDQVRSANAVELISRSSYLQACTADPKLARHMPEKILPSMLQITPELLYNPIFIPEWCDHKYPGIDPASLDADALFLNGANVLGTTAIEFERVLQHSFDKHTIALPRTESLQLITGIARIMRAWATFKWLSYGDASAFNVCQMFIRDNEVLLHDAVTAARSVKVALLNGLNPVAGAEYERRKLRASLIIDETDEELARSLSAKKTEDRGDRGGGGKRIKRHLTVWRVKGPGPWKCRVCQEKVTSAIDAATKHGSGVCKPP